MMLMVGEDIYLSEARFLISTDGARVSDLRIDDNRVCITPVWAIHLSRDNAGE